METTIYGTVCLVSKQAVLPKRLKPLEVAVRKRIAGAQPYLAQAYNRVYRYEDAIGCYEEYIEALKRRNYPPEEAEKLLEKSKADFRMLKGVERVCVIDSFVVNKAAFLNAYKISEESGNLYTYNDYFKTGGNHPVRFMKQS